jgi:hypothetical protein
LAGIVVCRGDFLHYGATPTRGSAAMNNYRASLALLCGTAVLAACGGFYPNPGSVAIQSDPSGADVYVLGKKVGTTPVNLALGDMYPSGYSASQAGQYGVVRLQHEGCKDYLQRVDSATYGRGIKAVMDCGQAAVVAPSATSGPDSAPVVAQPAAASPAPVPAAPPAAEASTVEQRLQRVKDLLGKGLITPDEAEAARKRILEGL